MRFLIALFAFLGSSFSLIAQTNLVRDSSFEIYDTCNVTFWSIDSLTYWFNPTNGSPDLLTPCNTHGGFQTPSNYFGFQTPKTGISYIGFCPFSLNTPCREYLATKLRQKLANQRIYKIRFYLSMAEESFVSIDNIGILFTKDSIVPNGSTFTIDSIPQLITPNNVFLTDTSIWTMFEFYYTAVGYERFFTIGNFKDDSHTNYEGLYGATAGDSYYYIDDVSVRQLPDSDTSVYPVDSNIVSIPSILTESSSTWIIQHLPSHSNVMIFDELGRVIMKEDNYQNGFKFSGFPAASYFYKVQFPDGSIRKGKVIYLK